MASKSAVFSRSLLSSRTLSVFSRSRMNAHAEDPLVPIISHIGEFGKYQKILFVLMIPFAASYAYVYMAQLFIIATPEEYWCKVPDLSVIDDWKLRKKLALPTKNGNPMFCHTWDTEWELVVETKQPPPSNTSVKMCTTGFEYDLSHITYETVVTERNWVCDVAYYVPVSQCFFFLGSVVGGLITGWMADEYGRVPALVVSNLAAFVGGVGCIYTSGFWDFTFWRFIGGCGYDNCFIMIYILVMEYVGPSWRTIVASMSFSVFFGGFGTTLPLVAYLLKDWRLLMWVTSLPMLVGLFSPWLVPESASWLASRGQTVRAESILRKFGRINKKPIPDELMNEFIKNSTTHQHNETLRTLFHSRILARALIMMIVCFGCSSVVYDGLMRMSESMGFDFFITFALNNLMEIPATTLIALKMDKMGRQPFAVGPMTASGILAIFAALVPTGILTVLFAVTSRFAIIMSFNGITQWAPEILPTAMRASGNSLVHISGYIASASSPFITFLDRISDGLPYIVMAVISFLGAFLALFLPETKGLALPQDIEEGEMIIRDHTLKFFRPRESVGSNPSNFDLGNKKPTRKAEKKDVRAEKEDKSTSPAPTSSSSSLKRALEKSASALSLKREPEKSASTLYLKRASEKSASALSLRSAPEKSPSATSEKDPSKSRKD